jgi:hypothetical protein
VLLAGTVPTFAQEEHQEEGAKPAQHEEQAKPKQEQEAKPQKPEQAKPEKRQQEAKPVKQEQAKPERPQDEQAKPQKQEQQAKSQEQNQQKQTQQQAKGHAQQSHAQYAQNGQKDSRGHEYNESRFGPNHHAHFEASGGREYDGRREYSYGGYWFYAGAYPPWFYQRDVYFVMGPDGLWYAVAYDDPSLTFQVNIE